MQTLEPSLISQNETLLSIFITAHLTLDNFPRSGVNKSTLRDVI